MGNSCTHGVDAISHLITEDELHEAVRSIEEWQKAQANAAKNGGTPGQATGGPLLQRVGGQDVVKKVVELFYRKLYADENLLPFLHDQEMTRLRAKQSAFMSWLFGPPNVPYTGKSVRVAHLRIITQRGFAPEHFDVGMTYFEEAMRELGAPEIIIGEVMRRVRPYKDAIFTPSSMDAAEEARWAVEEHKAAAAKEEAAKQEHLHATPSSQLASTAPPSALATDGGAAASKPPSRQCPFTSGRLSRPTSAAVAAAAINPTAAAAVAAAHSSRMASPAHHAHPSVVPTTAAAAAYANHLGSQAGSASPSPRPGSPAVPKPSQPPPSPLPSQLGKRPASSSVDADGDGAAAAAGRSKPGSAVANARLSAPSPAPLDHSVSALEAELNSFGAATAVAPTDEELNVLAEAEAALSGQ